MSNELSVRIDHVSKTYRLGAIGGGTLRGDLQSWWAGIRGKEDPNTMIGQTPHTRSGERFLALDDISLDICKGEAVGIIGHNGAGKSTLLKLLSRVTAPTKGTISYNGRVASMLEVGTGFHPELTGRENVYMNGAILGMTRAEIDRKFDRIVEFAEIEKFIDTPVKRYSSGMYVKLAFSVAAHLDSEIMVMDEVLAVGDMNFQQKCLNRMGEAASGEGRTVLYVSHNMNTIRRLCSRCIVLDHGRLVYDGDVETAIFKYMNISSVSQDVDYDLTDKRMKHLPLPAHTKMKHLTLVGKELPRYEVNEPIVFDLTVETDRNVRQLCVRFEIKTLEQNSIGSSILHNFTSLKAEERRVLRFETKAAGLAPGTYAVLLVLYEVNEWGTYNDLDAIFPVFTYEVVDTEKKMKINWNSYHLGRIKFEDMRFIGQAEDRRFDLENDSGRK